MVRRIFLLLFPLLLGACGGDAPENPIEAEQTYGAPVDATDAIPVPAVAAEPDRYIGRRVTIDGRIVRVARDGCTLALQADAGPPLLVTAPRSGASACGWQVPDTTDGFAVAVGRLRVERDTLHLTANGVQVTPVQVSEPDS